MCHPDLSVRVPITAAQASLVEAHAPLIAQRIAERWMQGVERALTEGTALPGGEPEPDTSDHIRCASRAPWKDG